MRTAFIAALGLALLGLATPARAGSVAPCTDSQSDLQNLINADIKTGVNGGITAPTVNSLMTVMNDCYASTESMGSGVLTALGYGAGQAQGFALLNGSGVLPASQGGTGISSLGGGVAASLGQQSGDLRAIFTPGGTDNATAVAAWLATTPSGRYTLTPTAPNQQTGYYFSQPFDINVGGLTIECGGPGNRNNGVFLVFAPGIYGVIQDVNSQSDIRGCGIFSLGYGTGAMSYGSQTITNVSMATVAGIPATTWSIGDGIVAIDEYQGVNGNYGLAFPTGAVISGISGSSITVDSGFPINYPPAAQTTAQGSGTTVAVTALGTTNGQISNGDVLKGTGIGAGITVSSQAASGCTATASASAGVLTVTAVSAGSCIPGMTVTGTYIPFGTKLGTQISGSAWNTGTYNLSSSLTFSSEAVTMTGALKGIGLYNVSSSVSFSSESVNFYSPSLTGGIAFLRLPVTQAFSVTTSSGSNSVTVVAGPRLIRPGDMIWSDAFLFGHVVYSASGTVGNQTLTMQDNATVTHTSGSGKMWIIPAALERLNEGQSHNLFVSGWGAGIYMPCATLFSYNCTTSQDDEGFIQHNFFGRYVTGDNTGASTSHGNLYAQNFICDICEFGSLGSFYSGDNPNSGESGQTNTPVMLNCVNQNYSVFIGSYYGGQGGISPCLASNNVLLPTSGNYNGALLIGSLSGQQPANVALLTGNTWSQRPFVVSGNGNCETFSSYPPYEFLFGLGPCNGTDILTWTEEWSVDGISSQLLNGVQYELYPGTNYTGYGQSSGAYFKTYPRGFTLADDGQSTGQERHVGAAGSPSPYSYHLQGDWQLNIVAAAGGSGCWHDTASGAHWYPGCPISNNASVPDYTAQTVRSGQSGNTDIAGRVTLSTGAGSYSLTQTYASAPNCLCADVTTPANACAVSESTSALTFTGTGSDVVKYVCVGRN